jgi:molybdate transport system substrate-binding protein
MTTAEPLRATPAMPSVLNVLCAGAVKGLAGALQAPFERAHDVAVAATFDAVGALRDRLRGGAACDVLVVTRTMIEALIASGELRPGSGQAIGRVATALAVPAGAPPPASGDAAALAAALRAASALYFPDATRSTAGAHVASMLDRLGLREVLAPRLRMFANGATAMRALAEAGDARALGCTQASEIRATPGVTLAGALPAPFALETVYSGAVATAAANAELAQRFIALLGGGDSRELRRSAGFDDDAP